MQRKGLAVGATLLILGGTLAPAVSDTAPLPAGRRTVFTWFPKEFGNLDTRAIDWSAITHLSFRSVVIQADGSLKETRTREAVKKLVDEAHAHGVRVSVLVWGTSAENSSRYLAHRQDEAVRSLAEYVKANNLDAVDMDDETWGERNTVTGGPNRDLVTGFFRKLSVALKEARPDTQLFWASPPVVSAADRYGASWPDYRAIADVVDGFCMMSYCMNPPSIGWTTGSQPVAGGGKAPHTTRRDYTTCIGDYLRATGGRKEKLILGIALDRGGSEWDCRSDQPLSPTIGKARKLTPEEARASAAKHGRRFEPQQEVPWYCYQKEGHWVQGWYEDDESLAAKLDLAREQDLQGVCLWVVDGAREPRATFDLIRAHLQDDGRMADHIARPAGGAAPGSQAGPLFADDFTERRDGWEPVSGAWAWRDGKLAQSAPADNYHRIVCGETLVEGSIAVEGVATAVNSSGQGCIGVVCKHLDERNWVAVRYGAYGSVALLRVVEGKKEILPLRTLALEVGKAYRCEVRLGHGVLVALLDGKVVGMQADPFAGKPGRPGIYAQSPAEFTRVTVSGQSDLDGGPAAALPAGTTRVTQESPAWALEGVEYAVAPLSPTVGSAASCSIALYVRNRGKEPATVTDVSLDGKPAAALIEEGRMAWWRCRPERVAPGGVAQVLLKMASLEAHEAARIARKEALAYGIRLESAAGPLAVECALSPEPSPLQVHFIAFDQGLRMLHLYLGAAGDLVGRRVTRVEVNGADVTARTRIPGDGRLRADTLPLRVELPGALAPAAPVVVMVQAEGGTRAGHAVRAFPSRFPVQVVILGKQPGPEALAELAGLCFTDVGLCGGRPELVGEMGKHGLAYFPYAYPNAKAIDALTKTPERPEVTGWWIDEIDGWKKTPRDAQEMLRQADAALSAAGIPPAPYCMNIMAPWGDNGYIELADALSHEYGIDGGIHEQGSYRSAVDFGAPGDISRRELRTARRPWWPYFRNIEAVLLLEPDTKKVVQHYRPIDPRELRLIIYSCLANGAKGALHWNYGLNYFTPKQLSWLSDKYDAIRMNMTALKEGEAFGVPIPQELRDGLRAATHECGRLNAELRLLGPLLAMGDVSDLAAVVRCSPERSVRGGPAAHARAILCGLDTIVLLAVNLNIDSDFHARKPAPVRSYEPVAAEVALEVPPWLRPADVFRVSWRGIEPLSPEKGEAGLRFSFPELAVTDAVVITADRSLRPRMQRDLKELQSKLHTAGIEIE